jgi:hypothetical protein
MRETRKFVAPRPTTIPTPVRCDVLQCYFAGFPVAISFSKPEDEHWSSPQQLDCLCCCRRPAVWRTSWRACGHRGPAARPASSAAHSWAPAPSRRCGMSQLWSAVYPEPCGTKGCTASHCLHLRCECVASILLKQASVTAMPSRLVHRRPFLVQNLVPVACCIHMTLVLYVQSLTGTSGGGGFSGRSAGARRDESLVGRSLNIMRGPHRWHRSAAVQLRTKRPPLKNAMSQVHMQTLDMLCQRQGVPGAGGVSNRDALSHRAGGAVQDGHRQAQRPQAGGPERSTWQPHTLVSLGRPHHARAPG